MKTIVFVCHGNICRSTMAEFLFSEQAKQRHAENRYRIFSRATSTEELGNPVHPQVRKLLGELGISTKGKFSEQITAKECDEADLIIVMDRNNRRNLSVFIGPNESKVHSLLSFAGEDRDIADPWYTGNFMETYRDIMKGLEGLWNYLEGPQS